MTTITRNGVEFNVVYIDPTAGSAGTGETYDSPLTDFPSTVENQTCYLVRRTSTDYKADMRMGDYRGTIFNFMIMGMPKSTDEEWKYLNDSDVKSAWGSDAYDYANIRWNTGGTGDNASYSFTLSPLQNLFISRSYLYRDSNSAGSNDWMNPMIYITDGQSQSNVYFNFCKFSADGCNLDDATWRANNSDFPNGLGNRLGNYLYSYNLKSFDMNNCTINISATPSDQWHYYWYRRGMPFVFRSGKLTKLSIKNTKMYSTWSSNPGDRKKITNAFIIEYQPRIFNMLNVELNSVMYGTNACPNGFICCLGTNTNYNDSDTNQLRDSSKLSIAKLKNIVINFIKIKDALPSGIDTYYNYTDQNRVGSMIDLQGLQSYDIDTFIVNGDISGCEMFGHPCLFLRSLYEFYSGLCKRSIKNVKINFGTDYTTLKYWSPTTGILNAHVIDIGQDWQQYESMRFYNYNDGKRTPANYSIIENIEVNAPLAAVYFNYCNIKKGIFNTYTQFGNNTNAEIDYLSNYFSANKGFQVGNLCYVRIKEYNANLNSPLSIYNGQSQIDTSTGDQFLYASDIYVDKTNVALLPENSITYNLPATWSNNLICPNYLQTNQYIQLAKNGYMKSWNTVRTGSSSLASIKCYLSNSTVTSGIDGYGITLGTKPYKGIQIEPSNTGNQTLKVYIAYKNFNQTDEDNLIDRVFVEAEVPNNGFGTNEYDSNDVYDSRSDGYIEDDNSSWSNDTGLTCKVINIPVNVIRTDKPINVRITYEVEGSTKYMYIDPDIKLV